MPRPVVNILISVDPDTVTQVEELLEKLRLQKSTEAPRSKTPTLTPEERLELNRIEKSRPAAYVDLWLSELNKRKKKERCEFQKGPAGLSSRRALIVRLVEVGLKHADEV